MRRKGRRRRRTLRGVEELLVFLDHVMDSPAVFGRLGGERRLKGVVELRALGQGAGEVLGDGAQAVGALLHACEGR